MLLIVVSDIDTEFAQDVRAQGGLVGLYLSVLT